MLLAVWVPRLSATAWNIGFPHRYHPGASTLQLHERAATLRQSLCCPLGRAEGHRQVCASFRFSVLSLFVYLAWADVRCAQRSLDYCAALWCAAIMACAMVQYEHTRVDGICHPRNSLSAGLYRSVRRDWCVPLPVLHIATHYVRLRLCLTICVSHRVSLALPCQFSRVTCWLALGNLVYQTVGTKLWSLLLNINLDTTTLLHIIMVSQLMSVSVNLCLHR